MHSVLRKTIHFTESLKSTSAARAWAIAVLSTASRIWRLEIGCPRRHYRRHLRRRNRRNPRRFHKRPPRMSLLAQQDRGARPAAAVPRRNRRRNAARPPVLPDLPFNPVPSVPGHCQRRGRGPQLPKRRRRFPPRQAKRKNELALYSTTGEARPPTPGSGRGRRPNLEQREKQQLKERKTSRPEPTGLWDDAGGNAKSTRPPSYRSTFDTGVAFTTRDGSGDGRRWEQRTHDTEFFRWAPTPETRRGSYGGRYD